MWIRITETKHPNFNEADAARQTWLRRHRSLSVRVDVDGQHGDPTHKVRVKARSNGSYDFIAWKRDGR